MKNLHVTASAGALLFLSGFLVSSCGSATQTNANGAAANKAPAPVAQNANKGTPTNTPPLSNTSAATPVQAGTDEVEGELQVGKSESVILYVGLESGDYAAYCFANDSEAGRAVLAAAKDRDQVKVTGTVDYEGGCKVPGLEADLSASGRLTKVGSVKSLGPRK